MGRLAGLGAVCVCVWQSFAPPMRFLEREAELFVPDSAGTRIAEVSAVIPGSRQTWVVDPAQGLIFQFDTLGGFQGGQGGKGDGLGEFMWPMLAGYRAGQLWVWDQQLSRVTVIDESKNILESTPAMSGFVVALADSGQLVYPTFLSTSKVPLLHITSQNASIDTVAVLPRRTGWISVPLKNGGIRVPQPFDRGELWRLAPSGEGLVVVDQSQARLLGTREIRIVRISTRGDTLFTVEVPLNTQPTTPAVVEAVARAEVDRAQGAALARGDSVSGDALEKVLQQIEVPAFLPPVDAVFLDMDGRTWLEVPNEGEHVRWIVLGPTGTILMRVVDQSDWRFLGARGTRVWLSQTLANGRGTRVAQFRLAG